MELLKMQERRRRGIAGRLSCEGRKVTDSGTRGPPSFTTLSRFILFAFSLFEVNHCLVCPSVCPCPHGDPSMVTDSVLSVVSPAQRTVGRSEGSRAWPQYFIRHDLLSPAGDTTVLVNESQPHRLHCARSARLPPPTNQGSCQCAPTVPWRSWCCE